MRKKSIVSAGLLLFLVLTSVFAINTSKIDVVRGKETLADTDTVIIEEFLSDAFTEILAQTDFSDIAAMRNTIVSKSTATIPSGQILYGPKYISAVQTEIANALKTANALTDESRKTILTTNLLILINDLSSIETSKMSLDYLQNSYVVVRYWAVNSLANSNIVSQLNAGSEDIRKNIAQKLLNVAKTEQSPEILILLVRFAAELKDSTANDILSTIAQKRIDLYLAWQANDEMVDEAILKSLTDRTKIDTDNAKIMTKYFSTLYSLVIQKYALGSETNKNGLVTVIVQAEKYVQMFIPDWNGNFKRAIEKSGSAGLLAEHDSLFGSASAAGRLPAAAGFDYGKNTDGSVNNAPPTLSKPLTEKTQVETPAENNQPAQK